MRGTWGRSLAAALVIIVAATMMSPIAHAQSPAPPAQPDLFQETLKTQRPGEASQGFYDAAAVVANSFLIPGRTITCVVGSAVGIALLALTFGSGYKAAAGVANEGCGGKWVVSGDDLRPDERTRAFEWER